MRYILAIILILTLCLQTEAQTNRINLWQLKYAPGAGYVPYSDSSGQYGNRLLADVASGSTITEAFILSDSLYFVFESGDTLNAGFIGISGSGIDTAYVLGDSLFIVSGLDTITAGYVRGPAGDAGAAGADGLDGNDGVGIDSTYLTGDSLYVVLTDATILGGFYVRGPQGSQGIQGDPGAAGADGLDGNDGVGIDSTYLTGDSLYVVLTDATILGGFYVRGPQGSQGIQGDPGAAGADGLDGNDGVGIDTVFISGDSLYVVNTVLDTINAGYLPGASGGDNWGAQVVVSDATLTGVGTAGDPLKVDTTIIATQFYVTDQGYTTNTGTVTSVGGTGTVNGITLSGTVTNSGNLTLGGTLSGVNLASQVTGTLPVDNGGTGATTLTGVLIGNGTSAVSSVSGTASQLLRRNAGNTAYEFFTHSFLTGNQTITLSGDVTGSGTTGITTSIAANAVTNSALRQSAGRSVIGRSANSTGNVADITAGGDNQFLVTRSGVLGFGSLAAGDIPDISGTYYLASNPAGYTTNTGTVTSVALTVPSILAVSGSPITGAGTLGVTLNTQTANTIFSGPTTGGAATPTFRSLVSDDIPNLDMAKITTGNLAWSRISTTPTTLSGYGITDGVVNTREVATSGSLTGGGDLSANRTLSLVNDSATPGNSKYYGTDGAGAKGFYDLPTGGPGSGEVNLGANLGAGSGIYAAKVGDTLQFKSLVAGYNIDIQSDGEEITLAKTQVHAINTTASTTYTFSLPDANRITFFTNTDSAAVTVPTNAAVSFPVGQQIDFVRYGTGKITVVGSGGVTINNAGEAELASTYNAATLIQRATDEWLLIGGLIQTGGAGGGDNWGAQTVESDATLTGLGTAASTLKVDTTIIATQFYVTDQNYITANQTITLSGDVTGSGTTGITTSIAANAVTNSALRQSLGLSVIGRSANTTGNVADITAGGDNQFLVTRSGVLGFGSLAAGDIPDISGTYYLASNPAGYTTNTGTVTSVALTVPSILSVSGSPITGAGTLGVTLNTQSANTIFSGPTTGGAAAPTFRSLVSDDIPNLDMAKITTGNLAWSRISTTPTTLAGYGITDAATTTALAAFTLNKSVTIEDPTATENITLFRTPVAITITNVGDVVQGSTPSVSWNIRFASTRNSGSPTNVFTSDRTTTTLSGANTTTFANAAIPAGSWVWLVTSAQTGTVDELNVSINYTND